MQPRQSRWELYPQVSPEQIAHIQAALPRFRLSPLVVQLLANRDYTETGDIECFLDPPSVNAGADPLLMVGMSLAVDRIGCALDRHEKIVVYGDFDADGVTSTALLCLSLKHFGADVEPYVPHRVAEGYGLNMDALRGIHENGAKLVITVDCGVSNKEEARQAKEWGLDLIVTDHHHLPADLPEVIVINPKQYVDGCEEFEYLAGVGVAYQLVRALVKRRGKPNGLRNKDLLGLVAIGTVADVAPLKGANRSLVRAGLEALPDHNLPGIKTLLEFAHVSIESMDTERIGFVIGPRLNAAGRIDDARTAYRLLMTDDRFEARELAQKLEAQNRRRQAMMNAMTDQARSLAQAMSDDTEVILLHKRDWASDSVNPLGVVGLVAGKLVEEFGRPALVLAPSQVDGVSKGSARSTPDFDIHAALTTAYSEGLLMQFGGHSAAAGLTIRDDKLNDLKELLCGLMRSRQPDESIPREPSVTVDAALNLGDITFSLLDSINMLAPFGAGNPLPLFMAHNVRAVDAFAIRDTAHLKLLLEDETTSQRAPVEAIAFRMAHLAERIKEHPRVDLLFHIERREWRDDVHLQLRVRDLRLSQ